MASGLHIVSAGVQNNVQQFFSGDNDFITMDFSQRLSGENVSASGVTGFFTVYVPIGFTAFKSGTAVGQSGIWMQLSATGAPSAGTVRMSAKILTSSGKTVSDFFDCQIWSGVV